MTSWEYLFTRPPSRLPVLQDGGVATTSRTGRVGCPDTIRADPWQQWWTYARAAVQTAYHDPTAAPPTLDVYGPVLDLS